MQVTSQALTESSLLCPVCTGVMHRLKSADRCQRCGFEYCWSCEGSHCSILTSEPSVEEWCDRSHLEPIQST